jgi:hypothetical protein
MGSRPVAMIAVALLALVAGTCQSDDDADDTSPTTDRTTTTVSPEAEVEAAYLAYWDMFVRLTQDPDPADPEILERASGDALLKLSQGLSNMNARQQRAEFGPLYAHDVLSVEIEGQQSTVRDCAVDDSYLVDLATGETLAGNVATDLWEATMVRSDDRWLVDSIESVEAFRGAVSCE